MEATFRLMQASGVQGPHATREVDDTSDTKAQAVAWSMGQTGHPWDTLTVEIPEIDYVAEIGPETEAM